MAKEGDTYYVFSTGSRVAVICSKDMVNWEPCYRLFDYLPGWVIKAVQRGRRSVGAGYLLL